MVLAEIPVKSHDLNLHEVLNLLDTSGSTIDDFSISIGTCDINGTTLAKDLLEGRVLSLKEFAAQTKREIQRFHREYKDYDHIPVGNILFQDLATQNILKEFALFRIMHSLDVDFDDMENKQITFINRFLVRRESPPLMSVRNPFDGNQIGWDTICNQVHVWVQRLESFARGCGEKLNKPEILNAYHQFSKACFHAGKLTFLKSLGTQAGITTQFYSESQSTALANLKILETEYNAVKAIQQKLKTFPFDAFLDDYFAQHPESKQAFFRNNHLGVYAYQKYVYDRFPSLAKTADTFLSLQDVGDSFPTFEALIPEHHRKRHTYVTGNTGSGKTELMKVIAYNYVIRPDYGSVVILDPLGPFAKSLVRWKEFVGNDRLVYIEPFLGNLEVCPVINPFDIQCRNEREIDQASQAIKSVFEELLKDTSLTLQMDTLLAPSISTIIRMRGTIKDLQRFMLDDSNQDLIETGLRSPNIGEREFFQSGFKLSRYSDTKKSIYTKIQSLLNMRAFYYLLVGKSTVDLVKALREKKVIVFHLPKGEIGEEASSAIGRFVLALIQSAAFQNSGSHQVPTHVFVDECQMYITKSIKTILTQTRNFGLHLTLAQQILGQDMDSQLTSIVLGNTTVKLTGKNGLDTLRTIALETEADLEDLQKLRQGEFFLKTEPSRSFPVKVHRYLVENKSKYEMSRQEWGRIQAEQIKRYYRSTEDEKTSKPKLKPNNQPKYDL